MNVRTETHGKLKTLLCIGLIVVSVPMAALQGFAYVLDGPHVLEMMTRKKSNPQTLMVEQQVTIEDPDLSNHPVELDETLRFSFPDSFRSDTQHEQTHRILVVASDQALVVVDDQIVSNRQGRFDRYKDVLLYRTRDLLHQALLTQGVDVGQTSLGRWDDHIVIVIGAQYPDESVSQLWVDKDLFLPLRLIVVTPEGSSDQSTGRLEFIYRDWQKVSNVWYPMQIETNYNQKRIRLVRAKLVKINEVFEAELLSIPYLMTVYTPVQPDEPVERNENELDEVDRTIEDFRKKFEP